MRVGLGAPVQPGVMKGPWREPVSSPTQDPVKGTGLGAQFQGKRPGVGMGSRGWQRKWACSCITALHGLDLPVSLGQSAESRQGLPRIPRGIFPGGEGGSGPDWEWGSSRRMVEGGPGGKVGAHRMVSERAERWGFTGC